LRDNRLRAAQRAGYRRRAGRDAAGGAAGRQVVSLELAKPSAPVFKQLYYLYFERILPLLGKAGVGVDGPYRWLPESLRRFPHQAEVRDIFTAVGLRDAVYHELTGGIVAVHVGRK
jgi:demethylmenaquinone methyltransferase/2-methoxy-6-polyprenyl-1,4-benzoquinol methylase